MLTHAHNVFVSQWLQTGAIGFVAFVALLVALFWRYVRFSAVGGRHAGTAGPDRHRAASRASW